MFNPSLFQGLPRVTMLDHAFLFLSAVEEAWLAKHRKVQHVPPSHDGQLWLDLRYSSNSVAAVVQPD